MLEGDYDQFPLVVLPPEIPVSHESTKARIHTSDGEVISPSSKNRKIYGSHKRAQVWSDDELIEDKQPIGVQPKMSNSHKRAKVLNNDESSTKARELGAYLQSKKRGRSLEQAESIQAKLGAKYPSFIKLMLKSHVSGGFWLGLPNKFCDKHLPNCDTNMVLVDGARKETYSKYLARKNGLSGGWRGFSIDHALLEGDVLIFHLNAREKFKEYIIREQKTGKIGAMGLPTVDYGVAQQESEDRTQKIQQVEPIQETQTCMDKLPQSSSEGSEVIQGIQFATLRSFENFNVTVDGLIIDPKFSDSTRKKYYELCRSQNSFLHEHLVKGLNCNLVVGMVSEVINISDAICSYKVGGPVSQEDLQIWDRSLEGFEFLGMKVGFIRARVKQLMDLASEHAAEKSNRLKETIIKRALAQERMKVLEKKLTAVKEMMKVINMEVDDEITRVNACKQEVKFENMSAVLS